MIRRVAITGATGFIGQALCRRLLSDGVDARVLVRTAARAEQLPQAATVVRGDILHADSLGALIDGADAVIHCAGSVRGARQSDFDRVNVTGLANLLQAMRSVNPHTRLLSLSSLAAREPHLSFYARSKRSGEQLLQAEPAIAWTVFRPPAVYGPGDRELRPLFELMHRGVALVPGSMQARFSMIYIDDLVEAMLGWLHLPAAPQAVFTLEDGTPQGYDWPGVATAFTQLSGKPVRPLRLPAFLLDSTAWINRSMARVFGYAPMLTPEKLRELRHEDWVTDSSEWQQLTGWAARIRLREGLDRTLFRSPSQ